MNKTNNKIKIKTVRIVPKSNRQSKKQEAKWSPLIYINDCSFLCLHTCMYIKSGGLQLNCVRDPNVISL